MKLNENMKENRKVKDYDWDTFKTTVRDLIWFYVQFTAVHCVPGSDAYIYFMQFIKTIIFHKSFIYALHTCNCLQKCMHIYDTISQTNV